MILASSIAKLTQTNAQILCQNNFLQSETMFGSYGYYSQSISGGVKDEQTLFQPNSQDYTTASQQRLRCFEYPADMRLVGAQLRSAVEAHFSAASLLPGSIDESMYRGDSVAQKIPTRAPNTKDSFTGCNQYERMAAAALSTARIKGELISITNHFDS